MFPKYPQHVFYKFIRSKLSGKNPGTIIDCPCGEGYISSMISRDFPASGITGVDIDAEFIGNARKREAGNLSFIQDDIHHFLENCTPFDVHLLVNSLFLLPNPSGVLNKIHNKLKDRMIIIIPNTESVNFRNFQKMEPGLNQLVLNKEEACDYFQKHGYKIDSIEGVAYVPYIGNTTLSKLWKFRGLYIYTFDVLNKLLGCKPCYWGFVLSKG